MKSNGAIILALVMSVVVLHAQDEPRPGVQAPGFWLISPTAPTAGAVGLECVADMQLTYTVVFPRQSPQLGQSLVVTRIDESTHHVYTDWLTVAPSRQPTDLHSNLDVTIPVLPQNSTSTIVVDVPGATVGAVVSVSANTSLPDGIVIASARVVEGGKVEIRIANVSAGAIHVGSVPFAFVLRTAP